MCTPAPSCWCTHTCSPSPPGLRTHSHGKCVGTAGTVKCGRLLPGQCSWASPSGQFLPRSKGSLGMCDTQVPPSGHSCRDVTSLGETQGAGRPEALAHLPGTQSVADFRGNLCPWNLTFSSRWTHFLWPLSGMCRWQSRWVRAERLGNCVPFLPGRLSAHPTTPPSRASSGLWASSRASQSLAVFLTR